MTESKTRQGIAAREDRARDSNRGWKNRQDEVDRCGFVPPWRDLVILSGADYPRDQAAAADEEFRYPFLQVFVAVGDEDLEKWALSDFGTDREGRLKGVVEVNL